MGKIGRRITSLTALVLVCCLAVTTILYDGQQSVAANVSFNGIDSIIASNSESNVFNIVELVPNSNMAELGYMIRGQEPEQWLVGLQVRNSRDARLLYINGLKDKLAGITASDNTRPITYNDYNEKYVVSDRDNWNQLWLDSPEIIEKGTVGYRMMEQDSGEYDFNYTYSFNAEGTGEYNQNVDYFVPDEGLIYGVKFKAHEEGTIANYYEINTSSIITSQEDLQALKDAHSKNLYIYRVSLSNISGAYEFYDSIRNIQNFEDLPEQENYMYASLTFRHIDESEVMSDVVYYQADEVKIYTDNSGEYGAILDSDEPYVRVEDNTGYFNREDNETYIFVGEGNGKYVLTEDEHFELDAPVQISRVFYQGGFYNNNWFENGVFNQDNLLEKNMCFNVNTITPAFFSDAIKLENNVIYISATSQINGNTKAFSWDNDISWEAVVDLVKKVQSSGLPVIVDHSVLDGVGINKNMTNIQKLVAVLSCSMLQDLDISVDSQYSDGFWNLVSSNMINDNDNHFVNGSVYIYPGNSYSEKAGSPYFCNNFMSDLIGESSDKNKFHEKADKQGFGEIAQVINDENLSRKTENEASGENKYQYFDLKISKAIAIEYVISYSQKVSKYEDDTLDVLDIEPCYCDDLTTDALQKKDVEGWFGSKYKIPKVELTHMSMAEFIGNIEDLSKYDLIYFGLSTNKMNVQNGKTVYNDATMDGLIYSNVGDIAVVKKNHSGMLDSDYVIQNGQKSLVDYSQYATADYNHNDMNATHRFEIADNTYRYSGNDITREKMRHVEEYVKAGFPVVFANDFLKKEAGITYVNDYYIDNCSIIYELVSQINNRNNVQTVSEVSSDASTLYSYIELGKPKLNVIEKPKADGQVYVELPGNVIEEEFTIENYGSANANSTFDCVLYLDSNSDGKFSRTQEAISAADIKLYDNGKLVSYQYDYVVDENGEESQEPTYFYELETGKEHNYLLKYTLPDAYVGIIPWKLEVKQSDNQFRKGFEQGYVYVSSEDKKEKIRILQINQEQGKLATTFNMMEQYQNSNSKFHKLIDELKDFELDIKTIRSDEFDKEYKTVYEDLVNPDNEKAPYYDMLVIGFADMYDIPNANSCVDGIKEYINRGFPVLFTHDTTSFNNNPLVLDDPKAGVDVKWGYHFNTVVRSIVGMDRYGIQTNPDLKKGIELQQGSTSTGNLYEQAISYSNSISKDIPYVPRSNKTKIAKQSHGYAYTDLAQYAKKCTDERSKCNKYYYLNVAPPGSLGRTTRVQKVNSGQITNYPFILSDSFEVAQTHSQYYQLDMNEDADKDGECDIVVWYTLAGENGNGTIDPSKNSNTPQTYFASPKDVRNSYYIYTKGNVTYSGVGHRTIERYDEELKLYINTMIAAYSSASKAPKIKLTESEEPDSDEMGTIYVSYDDILDVDGKVEDSDDSIEQQSAEEGAVATKDLYFTVTDTNLVTNLNNKCEVVEFGVPCDKEEFDKGDSKDYMSVIDEDGNTVYLKKVDIEVFKKENKHSYNLLSSNVTYRAEIPYNVLTKDTSYVDLYLVAYTKIVRNSSDGSSKTYTSKTASAYDTIRLQRLGLYDLD